MENKNATIHEISNGWVVYFSWEVFGKDCKSEKCYTAVDDVMKDVSDFYKK